jgi:Rha family phage regulatory protein
MLNNAVTMSSREIAELTGKRHDNVLRDCRNLVEHLSANSSLSWLCKSTTYTDAQGKEREMYELDRDTTLTLISGYDAVLRMKIIKRWMELEEAQRELAVPQTYLSALKALVASEEAKQAALEKAKELETTLALDKPYSDLARAITGQATMSRRDWLALIKDDSGVNVKERALTDFLIDRGYCYRDQLTRELRAYAQHSHLFKLEVELINGMPIRMLKVTGDGVLLLTPVVVQAFAERNEECDSGFDL